MSEREDLGRRAHDAWSAWADEQPKPWPVSRMSWENCHPGTRESFMRIGEAVAADVRARCITELERYGWTLPAAILMDPLLPSLPQLHAWMCAHGWSAAPAGRAGSVWSHPDGHQFGVVDDDSDRRSLADTVQRLAFAADRPVAEVLAEMRAAEPVPVSPPPAPTQTQDQKQHRGEQQ